MNQHFLTFIMHFRSFYYINDSSILVLVQALSIVDMSQLFKEKNPQVKTKI